MAPNKNTFLLFLCFSLLFVFVQPSQKPLNSSETGNENKENEGNGEDGKEKDLAKVEEGNIKKGKMASGESGNNSAGEGKDVKNDEQKEFLKIVVEDKKTVRKHFLKIKPRLEEEEAAKKKAEEEENNGKGGKEGKEGKGGRHHRGGEKLKGKLGDELQGVANAIANMEMKCPGIFKRFFRKAVNFVKIDAAAERKEQEWSQNCHILGMMKPAMVDWLEFIAKLDEKTANGRKEENKSVGKNEEKEESSPNFPEKMSVRPILQKVSPIQNLNPNGASQNGQQGPVEFKGESVELEEILDIYEQIAKGKEPEDLRQLFWDNEAAYKFVKRLEQKLGEDEKHENMAEEDKDEIDLEEIWEEEKRVLGGQTAEFKLDKHQKKYSEQVDEHKEKEFSAFGTIWNYGKSIKNILTGQHQPKQLSVGA